MTLRTKKEKGFGLVILVVIIAVAGILITSTSLYFRDATRQMQLGIDQIKAYYLAQAGVMRALYNWRVSNATDINRRYTELNTTITGNQIFKTGSQANFAYFTFDAVNGQQDTEWFAGNTRLRRWRIRNIHSANSITVTKAKVSWSPVGTTTLSDIQLNNNSVATGAGGPFASGTEITLTNSAANRTLLPGAVWSGNNTYLTWNGSGPPDPALVTVEWTFADDSPTKDSKAHRVVYWNGAKSGAGRPTEHTFSVTSTGQVNQSSGGFKVLKTVKATVSGTPGGGSSMEITDWDKIEKNIP